MLVFWFYLNIADGIQEAGLVLREQCMEALRGALCRVCANGTYRLE